MRPELLTPKASEGGKPTTFVAFTPATSFHVGWQMGTGEERALLYSLLRDHLDLRGARATAGQRIFQGPVTSRKRFLDSYIAAVDRRCFEPNIRQAFLEEFDRSEVRATLASLLDDVVGHSALRGGQHDRARSIVGSLRGMLSRAAVDTLEPDLVILDEFQRFRDLLDEETGGEAAELARDLFSQPEARVLLISATPYKAFTYAEEAGRGASHYADFVKTLDFLTDSDEAVETVRTNLDQLRQAALLGRPTTDARNLAQSQLRKWIARTERPKDTPHSTRVVSTMESGPVQAKDFADFVALRHVANEVSDANASFSVEYWKSCPYFLNFLSGYRLGEHLRAGMKVGNRRARLMPLLRGTQRIGRSEVEQFHPLEWANARMRALAHETLSQNWWQLLWMPPSLPYHSLGGPYRSVDSRAITKHLIFSSWVAAPSAIASLLSYEVRRQIFAVGGHFENTPEARASIAKRLDYKLADGRPASMSTLALFWPQPALASLTDPLDAARASSSPMSVNRLLRWAHDRVKSVVGSDGNSHSNAGAVWYWAAPMSGERGGDLASALIEEPRRSLVEALAGVAAEDQSEADIHHALDVHVGQMLRSLAGWTPDAARPADLRKTSALLGAGAPGNIAWRALNRIRNAEGSVTDWGQWRAAAVLASGLRSLFARPDATLLIDSMYGKSTSTRSADDAYWRKVARYCIDGGLQAVLDEYIHHLAEESGIDTTTDEGLFSLSENARRAIALRESVYRATDIDSFEREGIAFPSHYALRFGSTRHNQDDARLPEVRAAFNSPFWPFVLATTSIGQEGVDFHWWCHSIIHWNLPANPVDFEQREGRIDRYKGHAIRKNVAAAHRSAALAHGVVDPWTVAFEAAATDDDNGLGDLSPRWMYPGDAQLQRRIMALPLSRDQDRWRQLQESLALYRLAFGQPRQEDMLAALRRRGITGQSEEVAEIGVDLRPPALGEMP